MKPTYLTLKLGKGKITKLLLKDHKIFNPRKAIHLICSFQAQNSIKYGLAESTVEPRYNEGPRDWQNMFVITRFRYIEVLFHIFYHYTKKSFAVPMTSLYRGSLYRGSTV